MSRMVFLVLSAVFGTACLVVYVWMTGFLVVGKIPSMSSGGVVWLGNARLGALSFVGNEWVAGNARGELLFFRDISEDARPRVYALSTYAISAPVLERDGVFFVGDENGVFWAFKPGVGVVWSHRTGNQITGGAVAGDGVVWVGSHDHALYAFDPATGALRHKVDCDGPINGTPVLSSSGSHVFLGGCDGRLRKIDAHTGEVTAEADLASYIPDSPVLFGGTLYALAHDGTLIALDAESFAVRYRVALSETFLSSPFATHQFLLAAAESGKVHVLDRTRGERLAIWDVDGKATPLRVGDDARGYVLSRRGRLSVWNKQNETWTETVLHDFHADFRRGVFRHGPLLLAADEEGGLHYYRDDSSKESP